MRILAIHITTKIFSVALLEKKKCFLRTKNYHRDSAQYILSMVKEILYQRNLSLTDLDSLAFNRGPDSFTNVRISTAIIQGLALGADLFTIGVSTLTIKAQSAFRQTKSVRVLIAIDAGMGEIYWAEYIRDKYGVWRGENTEGLYQLKEIHKRLMTLSGEWKIIGTGWKALKTTAKKNGNLILLSNNMMLTETAEDILPIASYLFRAGRKLAVEHTEPIYLRDEIARKIYQ